MNNVDKLGIVKVALFGLGKKKETGPDWQWLTGWPPNRTRDIRDGAVVPSQVGPITYLAAKAGIAQGVLETGRNPAKYEKGIDALYDIADKNKIFVDPRGMQLNAGFMPEKGFDSLINLQYDDFNKKLLTNNLKGMKGFIQWNDDLHPSALAHELGHAKQSPRFINSVLNMDRLALPGVGALGGFIGTNLARDEDTGALAAGAGTALYLPKLINEIDASAKGADIMRKAKIPGAWRAFMGLPTYLGSAALPGASYLWKKHRGGYNNE